MQTNLSNVFELEKDDLRNIRVYNKYIDKETLGILQVKKFYLYFEFRNHQNSRIFEIMKHEV